MGRKLIFWEGRPAAARMPPQVPTVPVLGEEKTPRAQEKTMNKPRLPIGHFELDAVV